MVIYMLFLINFAAIFAKIATRRLFKTIFFKKIIKSEFCGMFLWRPGSWPIASNVLYFVYLISYTYLFTVPYLLKKFNQRKYNLDGSEFPQIPAHLDLFQY